jgi:uncharacterized membrane protein
MPHSEDRQNRNDEQLADALGWFSLGLGVTQLLTPGLLNRVAGIRDDDGARRWQRIVGVREVGAFAAIMVDRPHPALPLWSRVAGDAMDLALLAGAWARRRESGVRLGLAMANIAAIGGVDAYAALRHTSGSRGRRDANGEETGGGSMHAKAAVTVTRPREQVESAWRAFEADGGLEGWHSAPADGADGEDAARLRFVPAPREQGTEVHVELGSAATANRVGEVLAKALGADPTQRVKDDLRRFKQIVETGQVVRSEAIPEGTRTKLRQRPAQPIGSQS